MKTASLCLGCFKNLCMRFSSHHMKIKGCNCWEWPGLTGRKRAPWSTSMFDGWPCSYWPPYLHCQHAPCDGYNLSQLPALSHSWVHHDNCLLWVDCEYLSGGTFFLVPPHHNCQVTPGPYLNVTMFQSVSWVWGPFLCSLTVPQQEFFSGPSRITGQGRKGSCSCTVCDQILLTPPPPVRLVTVAWVWLICYDLWLGLRSYSPNAPRP